ncbi:MAG: hypothetical protein EB116_08050 [Betaproteobacteria bacterium]|nr:hypothetical protein [Betaproteobacteria bacterium]
MRVLGIKWVVGQIHLQYLSIYLKTLVFMRHQMMMVLIATKLVYLIQFLQVQIQIKYIILEL